MWPATLSRRPVGPSGEATTTPPDPRQAPRSSRTSLSTCMLAGQGNRRTRALPAAASGAMPTLTVWKFTISASGSTL